jgi:UDP-2,3-diacylglucosamine hydrolase
MRAVFIADAHLRSPDDHNYLMLLRFLEEVRGTADLLVILGDLFEFWIGYPADAFPHYRPVLDSLLRLKDAGTGIVYCEGNHDFHLGPFFTKTLQAEVHPGPAVLSLAGKKVLICHGDEINRGDIPHRLLRALLHGPLVPALIPLVPASAAAAIARQLSRRSHEQRAKKMRPFDGRAMIRTHAAEWFEKGCSAAVNGHFHIPFRETSADNSRTILSLGDWITQFSYGEFDDGLVSLKTFSPAMPNSSR